MGAMPVDLRCTPSLGAVNSDTVNICCAIQQPPVGCDFLSHLVMNDENHLYHEDHEDYEHEKDISACEPQGRVPYIRALELRLVETNNDFCSVSPCCPRLLAVIDDRVQHHQPF